VTVYKYAKKLNTILQTFIKLNTSLQSSQDSVPFIKHFVENAHLAVKGTVYDNANNYIL